MDKQLNDLLDDYDRKKISRRELMAMLLATGAAAAAMPALGQTIAGHPNNS